ncbi:hypothetical protein LCGC14_0170060 [marine sediment metagenome]|jgi:hypothetical protein|uniref:Uncharacterized protein n=1 Tax=marine sediment metagenome TaxID=412755 RepID=A0A0F9V8I4_9ZZZZ
MVNFENLLNSLKQSIEAALLHEEGLKFKIGLLENPGSELSPRQSSKLRDYYFQLKRTQADSNFSLWKKIVVEPIFNILQRKLGRSYAGQITQSGTANFRIDFFSVKSGLSRGFWVELNLTSPEDKRLTPDVSMSVRFVIFENGVMKSTLEPAINTPIAKILEPLQAA